MSSEPLDMYGITQPESVSRREGMKALARIASRVGWARLALDPAKGELRPDTAKECLGEVAAKIKIVRAALAYPAPTPTERVGAGWEQRASKAERLIEEAIALLDESRPTLAQQMLEGIQRSPGDEGGEQHYVEIEFDGFSPSVKLVHPKQGCTRGEDGEDCWLTDWVEAEGAELLRGKLTLPVRWESPEDRDHPLFHVLATGCYEQTGDD